MTLVPKQYLQVANKNRLTFPQVVGQMKIGPSKGELSGFQKCFNKTLWLLATARNAIIVIVCGFIGYALYDGKRINNLRIAQCLLSFHYKHVAWNCHTLLASRERKPLKNQKINDIWISINA